MTLGTTVLTTTTPGTADGMTPGSMIPGIMAAGTADGMIRGTTAAGMVAGTALGTGTEAMPGIIIAGAMSIAGATSDSAEATGSTGPGSPPTQHPQGAESARLPGAQAQGVLQ